MLVFGMSSTGCSSMNRTGKGAVAGAGGGAIIGGIIGRATGSTARGAIIGAAVGGAAGAVIGRQMDKQAEELDDDLENATVTPIPGEDGETAGIAVRFDNDLLFDLGQSTLRPGVQADLRDLASSMRNYPGHDAGDRWARLDRRPDGEQPDPVGAPRARRPGLSDWPGPVGRPHPGLRPR